MKAVVIIALLAPIRLCGSTDTWETWGETGPRWDTGGNRDRVANISEPPALATIRVGQPIDLRGSVEFAGWSPTDLVGVFNIGDDVVCSGPFDALGELACSGIVPPISTDRAILTLRVRSPADEWVSVSRQLLVEQTATVPAQLVLQSPAVSSSWTAGSYVPFVVLIDGGSDPTGVTVRWTLDGVAIAELTGDTNSGGLSASALILAAGPHEAVAHATVDGTSLRAQTRFIVEE